MSSYRDDEPADADTRLDDSSAAPPADVAGADDELNSSTMSAAESAKPVAKIFPCAQCGADAVFDIASQKLKCPFCHHEQELTAPKTDIVERDFHDMLVQIAEHKPAHALSGQLHELTCSSCGGKVVFQGAMTSTRCPYCDTPTQRDDIHDVADSRINVDALLPFQIDRNQVQVRLTKWINSLWFAPNDFKKRGISGQFEGIYLPFWTFDSQTFNTYEGQRGDNYTVTVGTGKDRRTETRTRWSYASGSFQRFFNDVLVLASDGFPTSLINHLAPWPLPKSVSFSEEYLAGFLASTYTIELDHGFELARHIMAEEIRTEVRQRIGGDHQRISNIDTDYHDVTFKYLLLPVWSMSYKYKDKVYNLTVNGVTGKVSGNRPYSAWKIALTCLIVGALAASLVYFFQR